MAAQQSQERTAVLDEGDAAFLGEIARLLAIAWSAIGPASSSGS